MAFLSGLRRDVNSNGVRMEKPAQKRLLNSREGCQPAPRGL